MVRGFLLGVLATIVVAAVCGYIALRNGLVPANADAEPGWLEIWAANTSLDATLDREAPKGANPVALTDDNLAAGVELYGRHCAVCHGTAQGAASASAVAKGLYPQPPQLATDGVEDDPEGFSFWKIKHGIRWTPDGSLSMCFRYSARVQICSSDKLVPHEGMPVQRMPCFIFQKEKPSGSSSTPSVASCGGCG